MIEARALVSINFLNLSENYDFMSRWLGVYDKYAKLLKGSSDAVVKDGSGKIPESANDKVDLTNKHLALQAILAEYGQKLNKSHLYSENFLRLQPSLLMLQLQYYLMYEQNIFLNLR